MVGGPGRRRRGCALGDTRPTTVLSALLALLVVAAACGGPATPSTERPSPTTTPRQGQRPPGASASPCAAAPSRVIDCLVAMSFVSTRVGYGVYAPDRTDAARTGSVVTTTDGGRTWRTLGPVPGGVASALPTLHFVDSRDGLLYGTVGTYVTHDGGRTWHALAVTGRTVDVASSGRDVALTSTTCSATPASSPCAVGLEVSHDAGRHWTPAALPTERFRDAKAAFGPGGTPLVGTWAASSGTGPGALLVFSAGTGRWRAGLLPCPPGDQAGGSLSVAPSSGTLWLACVGPTTSADGGVVLFRSPDLGGTWVPGTSGALAGGVESLVAFSATRAWALELGDGLVVTSDGGESWQPASPAMDGQVKGELGVLDVLGPTDAFLASPKGGLWHTTDGVRWEQVG